MKIDNKTQDLNQEQVTDEETFVQGEAYPNRDDQPCDNLTGEEDESVDSAEKMAEAAAEWRDKYMRLQAEFDNYRKRTLKEKMELVSSASEDVIKALLPVIDDLDRALEAMETASDVAAVKQGVVLISNKLGDTLRSRGVSEIEALGKVLDVDFHEAVAKIPSPRKSDKGKVVECVQKGYTLNDKVIRHSKVVVGE